MENQNNTYSDFSTVKKFVFEWLEIIITAIIAVVIIFTFIFKVVTIEGGSMKETIHNGEKVIISNMFYTPKNGDSSHPYIKRIIATEGQTVDIDFEQGIVFVDGVALDEPYTRTPTNLKYDIEFPVLVDDGCVFVLGDNRNDSRDSRSSLIGDNGMIDTRYILGKAVFRILPFDKIGGLS